MRAFIFLIAFLGITGSVIAQFPPTYSLSDSVLILMDEQDKNAFEIDLKTDFMVGFSQVTKVKEKLGTYKFKSKVKATWTIASIDSIYTTDEALKIYGKFSSKDEKTSFELNFSELTNKYIQASFGTHDLAINRIEIAFSAPESEHYFGMGEQFSHLDFKGKKVPIFVEEQGVGRGDKPATGLAKLVGAAGDEFTTYCPIPFTLTSEGRGIMLENFGRSEFDFRQNGRISIGVNESILSLKIFTGESPLEILEKYTLETGRFRILPDWAFGTWLGLQGGPEKVKRIVSEAKKAGNPVSAVWIQDWVGKRKTPIGSRLNWNWEANEEAYPNFKQFIQDLNSEDVKVLGYINSFLVEGSPMAREAAGLGYLIKNKKGEDYLLPAGGFKAYLVDLANPEARDWLRNIILTNLVDVGLSGWMADFAEWLPLDAANAKNVIEGEVMHNSYPLLWLTVNRQAIETSEKDLVFFSRSGFRGAAQVASIYWAGDQTTNWGRNDGLPSALTALLSSGMSGIAINHSDIGGYTNVKALGTRILRDRELLYRWIEMAAFTPVFRTHEGLMPERNMQVYSDPAAVEFFAKFGKLHYDLSDYLKAVNREAADKGWPMVRHPWLQFPNDPQTIGLTDQFMLGSEIMVLPVLEPGKSKVTGYFPAGEWEHLLTGEQLQGGKWATIAAPLGEPAVYIRSESVWKDRLTEMGR